MVAVQTTFAGVNVLYKLADNDGMKLPILVAYRFIFSTAFIVPLAIFVERKKRPKLTLMRCVVTKSIRKGLVLDVSYVCLIHQQSHPRNHLSFSGLLQLIVDVVFRMERLGWNTSHGAAKIMGTVLGVGGAMLLTFYKGADLNLWKTNVDLSHGQRHAGGGQNSSSNMGLGSILVIGSCTSYSIWLIIQVITFVSPLSYSLHMANMVKKYPCPYSVTALTSIMGAVQATVFGLCTNRHWRDWKLGWNVRLLTVAYSGMLASGLIYMFITLCVQMRGPLFVSAFNPLMLILVAIAGSLVLNERLHLGSGQWNLKISNLNISYFCSVLGAILIVLGLYIVLWGKNKEVKKVAQLCPVRETIKELDNGAIVGESESSFGVGDGESKHLSVQSGNDESRRIVVTSLV
ncbi:Drug/metabolite transporter [Cynara cardunculus var. scolymus]|uniref:Drug/metabolite transporter n=1 Tax=Cynara cardunculus var. scolymus TaxID=59895 RepID=A0A103Y3G9_CYNCS|nr:Drug/metabolite transporter [Cynara cardunculus var. scolymus]